MVYVCSTDGCLQACTYILYSITCSITSSLSHCIRSVAADTLPQDPQDPIYYKNYMTYMTSVPVLFLLLRVARGYVHKR